MSNFKEFEELKNAVRYLRKRGVEYKKDSNEYKNLELLFTKMQPQGYAIGILTTQCECGRIGVGNSISMLKRDSKEFEQYTTTGKVPGKMCEHCIDMFMSLQKMFDTDVAENNKKNSQFAAKFLMDLRAGKIELIDKGDGQVELKFADN